ncbi:MAG: hypothetical protein PHD97_08450 [Bacteroidales bacterium]|nr:hypothetical protein [Bacteroidales bacterium]
MGINIYMGLSWGDLDESQLSTLRQYGMYLFPSIGDTFALSHISDTIICGWLLTDEPDNAQWNEKTQTYDSCINPKIIIHQYDSIKLTDSTHPIYFGLGQGVSLTTYIGRGPCWNWIASYPVYENGYIKGCDITGYDIYPVNNTDTTTSGKLWYVAKGIDSLQVWSSITASPRVPSKPAWMTIEATKISTSSAAGPTPAQAKSEVWMAIIHGAKGIIYFPHSWIPSYDADALLNDAAMVNTLTSVDSMINALAPVLNSSNTGYATNTNANTPGVTSSNGAVPINYMTKIYNGSTYIFAVAMRTGTTNATFTVTSGTTVTVLGENRTINISGGEFTDNFAADYQVHLYKINTASSLNEEGKIPSARVFPNPSVQSLTVELDPSVECQCSFILYDQLGRVVYEKPKFTERKLIINKEELNNGMFFYFIRDNKNKIIARDKLIIE